MGCGGSKEEVATGNTVATKSLQRKKSDVLKSFEKAEIASGGNEGIIKESAHKLSMPVGGNNAESKEAGEGKIISKDSPDRYFSSRKDEVAVTGVAEAAAIDDNRVCAAIDAVDSSQVKNVVNVKDVEAQLNTDLSPKEKPEANGVQDSNDSDAATVTEKKE